MIGRLSPRRRRVAEPASGAEPTDLPPGDVEPAGSVASGGRTADADAVAPGAHLTEPPPGADAGAVPRPDTYLPSADPSTGHAGSVPAGLDGDAPPPSPGFRTRGRVRRRVRYLRRVRELGFRDLGGLAFDLHRFGREGQELLRAKLDALSAVDAELRGLETVLGDRRDYVELREPGVAACPRCAVLHGSEANFCPNCSLHLDGPMALAELRGPVTAAAPAPVEATPDAGGSRAADRGSEPFSSGLGPLVRSGSERATRVQRALPPQRTGDGTPVTRPPGS